MGININNTPTSDRTGKLISDGLQSGNLHTWKVDSDGDTSVTESESNGDTSVTESESNGDTSVTESESNGDTSVTESKYDGNISVIESDPDQEWSNGKINISRLYKGLKKIG